jgi:hypothetical protein
MTTATINNWCYSFDDDRSPAPARKPVQCLEDDLTPAVSLPKEQQRYCPLCNSRIRPEDCCKRRTCVLKRAAERAKGG